MQAMMTPPSWRKSRGLIAKPSCSGRQARLPGVAGIGEKTAAKLITSYGTLAALRAAIDGGDPALKGAQRARLEAAAAYLETHDPDVIELTRLAKARARALTFAA